MGVIARVAKSVDRDTAISVASLVAEAVARRSKRPQLVSAATALLEGLARVPDDHHQIAPADHTTR